MKHIGLFGGTFNPVHMAHLIMAEQVREQCRLERIIFIPSAEPPHKPVYDLAPAADRLEMVSKSIQGNPSFSTSDVEIQRGGTSYTIDTVKVLQETILVGQRLFFIMGGDSFPSLHTWKDIGELLQRVTFIVVNRPGYTPPEGGIPHQSVILPDIDIASSDIRQRCSDGKSIKYLVPDDVFRYIERKNLYQQS